MRNPADVDLTQSQRSELESWRRSGTTEARLAQRADIVLRCADGERNETIAAALRINADTASKWRHRFLKQGVDGLRDAPRSGKPRQITHELEQRIIEATLTPPKTVTHWSTRRMAKHLGISDSTVRTVWKRHGLKPHIVRTFKISNDPLFEEKVQDVVGLYLNPPDNAIVLSVDEKSQIQALDRTRPILPIRPGLPEHQTHDYKRHGTTTLFAALDVLTGSVIHQFHDQHRHQEFIEFLDEVDRATPADKDLHLIVDNYGTHGTDEVKAWLAENPRFTLHFTPTASSWMNLVERLFGKLTDERLRRGAFESVDALHQAIDEWIAAHNENPVPLKWVAKAKDILRKVKKYRRTYSALH